VDQTTDEEAAARRYEVAEEAFLAAIRTGRDRAVLTALCDSLAAQSKAWNAAAYMAYHASSGDEKEALDRITERTEVLENLWFDIAKAFHGREALHDG
jgi:Lon protease-like protein